MFGMESHWVQVSSYVLHTLYQRGDKSSWISSLEQKGLGPEGRILGEPFVMAFLVIYESPQLMEGTMTFGTHVGFEPRESASVNTEFPHVAEGLVRKASPGCGSSQEQAVWRR